MTLVNAWSHPAAAGSADAEREALIACDGCLPPRGTVGTRAEIEARGWAIGDLERGPHRCPWCARRRPASDPRRRSRPARRPGLPNLLVIGAGKSGTTSLHSYLDLHPEIHMSEIKELWFLHLPDALDRLDTYASFFDADAPVRGESSPIYTAHPLAPGVAERVRAALPAARLVYLVRDPVDRAVSHYCQVTPRTESIDDALRDATDPHNRFIAPGRYATQLEQYLAVLPAEQLLVVDHDDLLHRRRATLRRVFRFLGVAESFDSPGFEQRSNIRETRFRPNRVGTLLHRSRLAEAIRMLPPGPREALFRPARSLTGRGVASPSPSEELLRHLRDAYRGEVERLRELTGQPFAGWQI